ncbi:MAG: HlyD family secretion protein, partial [Gammaproteobacteria bacterium]|nr:HlyD family secretion protein [Gammaproteobacteria bacterium]
MVLAVVAVAFAVREGIFAYTHVYEPNARIQAHFTVLSSSINARVDKILVRRGDTVTAGMQLAKMDAAVAALDLETLSADADKERARRDQIDAELAYFRAELAAQADTSRAAISSLQAEYRTAKERHQIAKTNVERVRALLDRSVVSRQRIDEATDALLSVT